ncbi:DUF433 domain-containing protein [Desulfobacterales bacterium HSG2]|nr:DUF433 domain-containing protein [Desulfobacterales bacterium HSG2]
MESHPNVVRTERGLSIAGTRITLYDVMDYFKKDWPPDLIQYWLNLTDEQIADAIDYIKKNLAKVESEYQEVLRYAEELRQYYEEYNRERFAEIAAMPKLGHEELRARLKEWKTRLEQAS